MKLTEMEPLMHANKRELIYNYEEVLAFIKKRYTARAKDDVELAFKNDGTHMKVQLF